MANCKEYEKTLGSGMPDYTEFSDEQLMRAVRGHRHHDFWPTYARKPDQYAYVRRWATMLRREARRRGLL